VTILSVKLTSTSIPFLRYSTPPIPSFVTGFLAKNDLREA